MKRQHKRLPVGGMSLPILLVSVSIAVCAGNRLAAQSFTISPTLSFAIAAPCQWKDARRDEADAWVSTREELENAITTFENAGGGSKLIWIENAAAIDLMVTDHRKAPQTHVLKVPTNVTLASGRSATQAGGLLYFSGRPEQPRYMLRLSRCSRVTGLRLRGPSRSTARSEEVYLVADPYPRTTAIFISGVDSVIVDNNEFSDWPGAGVWVSRVPNTFQTANTVRVSNNFFHHNLMCGSGYGVVLDGNEKGGLGGYAHIDRNVFNYNRHAIAGDGHPQSGYLAEFNLVLSGGKKCDNGIIGDPGYYEQHFDMHGEHDGYGGVAGEIIHIGYNTIRGEQKYYVTKTRPAFFLRGTPTDHAYFYGNVLAHDDRDEAIKTDAFVPNLRDWGNQYDVDTSFELAVGDFDGDGFNDVFQATGTVWVFSARGQGEWRVLSAKPERLSRLRFGDFDGNGKTDVFTQVGSRWLVAYDGVSRWTALPAGSAIDMTLYRFGDFDGDGRTDVFRADGAQWFYSSGGATGWLRLAGSAYREDRLRFGDFDGNGVTDVFSFANGRWSVSYGGVTGWRRLNDLISSDLNEFVFADFNGDGATDIARQNGVDHEVSWGGITSWRMLHTGAWWSLPIPFTSMLLGDFDGDGRADKLHYQRSPSGSVSPPIVGERFAMSSGANQTFAVRSRHEMR